MVYHCLGARGTCRIIGVMDTILAKVCNVTESAWYLTSRATLGAGYTDQDVRSCFYRV
jgi:hypothetical protein